VILGRSGARKAYLEGRGSVIVRAKTRIEESAQGPLRHHHRRDPLSGEQGRDDREDRRGRARQAIEGIAHVQDESDRTACAW
jgi:DNA gyrase subunit A